MDSSDVSPTTSPLKDGTLNRNITDIINFLNSPDEKSDTVDSGTETSDYEPISDLLNGVIAYAEVKSNEDNRSGMIGRELIRLGARVERRFNKAVTHVVFYNGSQKTRERAEKNGLHLVSVSWIQKCRTEGKRLPEAEYPAAKISPKMIGTKAKKYRSMQPRPLEEELARSKERVKRKLNRENRWKILLEGEAYADYSPSYLSKLKVNPHLVPETPSETVGSSNKLCLIKANNMGTLAEEEECVSTVEESPIPAAAIHKRLFDSDDSGDENVLPPLWERVKKFTPNRRTLADNDDSDTTGSEMNWPRVGRSPEISPTKNDDPASPLLSLKPSDSTSEESLLMAKIGKRRSLGRKAVLNSAKKAMLKRTTLNDAKETTASTAVNIENIDNNIVHNGKDTPSVNRKTMSKLVDTSSSESTISNSTNEPKQKRGRRRSSLASKLTALAEDSESGSDVPRRRNLLRPDHDNLLNPSPTVTPSSGRVCVTPHESPSVRDILCAATVDSTGKSKSRRKSVAVTTPSSEKVEQKSRRRSALTVTSVPTESTVTKRKKSEPITKVPVVSNSPELEPGKSSLQQVSSIDDSARAAKRKRPETSSSESETNSRTRKPERKKRDISCKELLARNSHCKPAESTSEYGSKYDTIAPEHSETNTASTEPKRSRRASIASSKVASETGKTPSSKMTSLVGTTSLNQMTSPVETRLKETRQSTVQNGQELVKKPNEGKSAIVLTNLHRDERSTVLSIIKKLGRYQVRDRVDEATTHVVCGEKRRTLNVLHAIVRGCWLVGTEWVFKSLENNSWVEEIPYALDENFPSSKTSRNEKLRDGVFTPDLFGLCGSIFIHHKTMPASEELRALITLCNGEVVSGARNAKISVGKWRACLVSVSEQWILDSISLLRCQPFEPYLLTKER